MSPAAEATSSTAVAGQTTSSAGSLGRHRAASTTCETVDDGETPDTTITSGPSGPTNDTTRRLAVHLRRAVGRLPMHGRGHAGGREPADDDWDPCRPGDAISAPAEGPRGSSPCGPSTIRPTRTRPAPRAFTIDTIAPDTRIDSGPSGGGVTTNSTPEFFFSSPTIRTRRLPLPLRRRRASSCAPPPSRAARSATARTRWRSRRSTQPATSTHTPAQRHLPRRPPAAPAPARATARAEPAEAPVQQAKIIIGSLVLISGNAVKMSRKGRVPISLTCAGATKCSGRLSITTAEPVSKRNRKLVTLGAKKFTIAREQEAQDQRAVLEVARCASPSG